jgi:hypothetical protein
LVRTRALETMVVPPLSPLRELGEGSSRISSSA